MTTPDSLPAAPTEGWRPSLLGGPDPAPAPGAQPAPADGGAAATPPLDRPSRGSSALRHPAAASDAAPAPAAPAQPVAPPPPPAPAEPALPPSPPAAAPAEAVAAPQGDLAPAPTHPVVTALRTPAPPVAASSWQEKQAARLAGRHGRSTAGRLVGHFSGVIGRDTTTPRLAEAWQRAQTPFGTGRRIFVNGAHGGAGATTVAVCLAHELDARRSDGVALVDASPGLVGLGDRLTPGSGRPVAEALAAELVRSPQLQVYTPADPSGPAPGWRLSGALRRVAALTVVDLGRHEPPTPDPGDAVVVVVDRSLRGLVAAEATLDRLEVLAWPRTKIVVVLAPGPQDAGADEGRIAHQLGRRSVPVLTLPHDRHLAGSVVVSPARLAPGTELAVAELAATAVLASADPAR